MSLLKRLLRTLGFYRSDEALTIGRQILQTIQALADQEQRPKEAVAADLLSHAIDQREWQVNFWSYWDRLTRREQQVAALMCMDRSNGEIADELSIALSTAKAHVHNVLQKFEARNRTHLQHMLSDWDLQGWYESAGASTPRG